MSARTIIGANRRNNPPGGFIDASWKGRRVTRSNSREIKAAAIKFLDARGLGRGPDAFSGRQGKML
jgi:hypothetical protein